MFNCYKHFAAQDGTTLFERSGLAVIVLLQLHLDFKPRVDVNFISNKYQHSLSKRHGWTKAGLAGKKKRKGENWCEC